MWRRSNYEISRVLQNIVCKTISKLHFYWQMKALPTCQITRTSQKEALYQPKDASTYREWTRSQVENMIKELNAVKSSLVHSLRRRIYISSAEECRLIIESNILCIYCLPKIHKQKLEDTGNFTGWPAGQTTSAALLNLFLSRRGIPLPRHSIRAGYYIRERFLYIWARNTTEIRSWI